MSYKNPLLHEIYCECFFDRQINPLEQTKITQLFADKTERIETKPDFLPPNIQSGMQGGRIDEFGIRYMLWKNNNRELIQVFRNRIAFNYIPWREGGSYKGWDFFLQSCIKVIKAISELLEDNTFNKLSLCYIDKRDIEDETFIFGKYFNCDGSMLPTSFENTSQSVDIIFGQGNPNIEGNRQLKIQLAKQSDNNYSLYISTIIIDKIDEDFINNFEVVLKDQHRRAKETFENIITEYVRNEIMEGEYE